MAPPNGCLPKRSRLIGITFREINLIPMDTTRRAFPFEFTKINIVPYTVRSRSALLFVISHS
jgi:hypothetical protein